MPKHSSGCRPASTYENGKYLFYISTLGNPLGSRADGRASKCVRSTPHRSLSARISCACLASAPRRAPDLPRSVPVCPPVPANRCLAPSAPRRRRAQAGPAPAGSARQRQRGGSPAPGRPQPRPAPAPSLPLPSLCPVPSRPSPAPRKMEGYRRFLALLVSALLLGFVAVVCSLVWVFRYREGLGWDGGAAEFNWHPVLVVTGFVFIQGIGAWGPGEGRQGKGKERKARRGSARTETGQMVLCSKAKLRCVFCFLFLRFFFSFFPFEHLFTLAWVW